MNQHPAVGQQLLRAGGAALLFVFAQIAPSLHEAHEAHHDVHPCCAEDRAPHFDTCGPDHDHSPCQVCAAGRTQVDDPARPDSPLTDRIGIPVRAVVDVVAADPFHVETPELRGPPL